MSRPLHLWRILVTGDCMFDHSKSFNVIQLCTNRKPKLYRALFPSYNAAKKVTPRLDRSRESLRISSSHITCKKLRHLHTSQRKQRCRFVIQYTRLTDNICISSTMLVNKDKYKLRRPITIILLIILTPK